MKGIFHSLASLVMAGVLTASLAAQTDASRYDPAIQAKVALELAKKPEFRNVQSSTEDGIVTLTGTVELYQQKLDAAKKIRKSDKVQGVRNLIEVSSTVPMANSRRSSTASSTMTALAMTIFSTCYRFCTRRRSQAEWRDLQRRGRDAALALVNNTPGVKEVLDNIKVVPVSNFDDRIRVNALRAIYRDPVLNRYTMDPARS